MDQLLIRYDLWIIFAYLALMLLIAFRVSSSSRSVEGYIVGNRKMKGWVVGISVLGTFLSSISFLAVPASTYKENWNVYVFGLALPIAALIAVLFFIPIYRKVNRLSAYEFLEERFGYNARLYAILSYLVLQMLRIGTVMLLVAFAIEPLLSERKTDTEQKRVVSQQSNTQQSNDNESSEIESAAETKSDPEEMSRPQGYQTNIVWILAGFGILVCIYDTLGGIQAVIWTDVLQVIVLTVGACWCLWILIAGCPDGISGYVSEISSAGMSSKLSLGDWLNWDENGIWQWGKGSVLVVFLYGMSENLRNYSTDQNYVQRMLTASSDREAAKSIWIGALAYLPLSAIFCLIGTTLWMYYQSWGFPLNASAIKPEEVFPYFIRHELSLPVAGLVIAAILSAAMSTVDSSLNSCSTVLLVDVIRRIRKKPSKISDIYILRFCTVLLSLVGTAAAIGLFLKYGQDKSSTLLKIWWMYAGVAGAGLFGLFLLAWLMPKIPRWGVFVAVVSSLPVLLWGTILGSGVNLSPNWQPYQCPLHGNLVGIAGFLIIFVVGFLFQLAVKFKLLKENKFDQSSGENRNPE